MDNPFAKGQEVAKDILAKVSEEVNEESANIEEAEVTVPEIQFTSAPLLESPVAAKEPPLVVMQRILKDYDHKESDIPVNHPEYWRARRDFHREANP